MGVEKIESLNKSPSKKGEYLFWTIFIIILLILIYLPIHYSKNFWENLLSVNKLNPSYSKVVLIFQIVCYTLVILIIIFRKNIYRYKKEILLLSISALLCLLLIELGSRYYVCNIASSNVQSNILFYSEFNDCHLKSRYSTHPYLNDYGTPNFSTSDDVDMHNSLGFRGPEIDIPKPDERYRIVILGGSSAYESGVESWKDDFARQLQKYLRQLYNNENIEVINGALPGYTSYEDLINLEFRVLDLEPDMIIPYESVNDVHARFVESSSFTGDNTGFRKQWSSPKIPIIIRPMFIRLIIGNPIGIGHFINAPTYKIKDTDEENLATLEQNPPIYFKRNVENMIALSKYRNVSVLLSTWAYTNDFNDSSSKIYYEKGFQENNEVVKTVGIENDVLVYDHELEMPKDKIYWDDGRHVNEKGADIKGRLFAEYIYKNDLLNINKS
ncbi:hypothetical protein COU57_05925 [Candidatus Pacearchaeota archaeon CG10_big_fil_rev_8_21_14_0_10_32_14]|nr:MAG: hypothetical protein COU57_05925 [Candidatus Pacearchaeota archaeon CG10_big_fil_rev_8_21_14_0_10_32_14]